MRRGATLVVAMGVTLTGLGPCSAAPTVAGPGERRAPGTARLAGHPVSGGAVSGTKVVRYRGYTLRVPAAWPVYRLDSDPARCVRYDRHAVYLGTPGPDQNCPAHLAGRVATVSVQASITPAAPGGPAAGPMWRPVSPRSRLGRGLPGAGGTVLQDSADHELRAVLPSLPLSVTATYGGDLAQVGGVIRSLRPASGGAPAPGGPPPGAGAGAASPAGVTAAGVTAAEVTAVAAAGEAGVIGQAGAAGEAARMTAVAASGLRRRLSRHAFVGDMSGFDACTAPSLATMRKWRPYFGAVAIYIGGPEAACGYGNLSVSWIHQVLAMGWSLIPTYVGPQAPCDNFRTRIKVGRAHITGQRAADDAIRLARALGLRRGAPIYDDMEWYNSRKGICRRQVLSFLNGWTRQLRSRGYVPGVYSSASAAARDLGQTRWIYGKWLAKPNTLWFALWDGRANVAGTPYLSRSWWPAGRRIKQYRGGHRLRLNGATVNIDSDMVHGAVYR